jgi:hypothetical protein
MPGGKKRASVRFALQASVRFAGHSTEASTGRGASPCRIPATRIALVSVQNSPIELPAPLQSV